MRVLLFAFVFVTVISCKDGCKQEIAEKKVKTTDSPATKEEWIADFKKFRAALYYKRTEEVKTYFNFPIKNSSGLWLIARGDGPFEGGTQKDFTTKDFDKLYENIFDKHITEAILKIEPDKLFENKYHQAFGSGGGISYEIFATVQKNQLKLQYEYNKQQKGPLGSISKGVEGKIIFFFDIIDGKKIMFKSLRRGPS